MDAVATAGDLGAALGPLVAYAMVEGAGLRAAYPLSAALLAAVLIALAARASPAACAARREAHRVE